MPVLLSKPGIELRPEEQRNISNREDIRATRHHFLQNRASVTEITKNTIDFKSTDLPEHDGLYAIVLDNCFTAAECNALISMAEAQTNGVWEQAMINVGGGRQELRTDSRDCGRIIWDDEEIVQSIWNRIQDQLPEIQSLSNVPKITGYGPTKRNETWRMARLNERMRFLKYGEGQYFRPHYDGTYVTPDGQEMSFYTLHVYLNDSADGRVGGGATTFHSLNMQRQYDVVPKIGRVLIFQHRGLLHSGADVTSGTKFTLRTDLMYKKATE